MGQVTFRKLADKSALGQRSMSTDRLLFSLAKALHASTFFRMHPEAVGMIKMSRQNLSAYVDEFHRRIAAALERVRKDAIGRDARLEKVMISNIEEASKN